MIARPALHGPPLACLCALLTTWVHEVEAAPDDFRTGPLMATQSRGNVAAKTADAFVTPSGHLEVGGDLVFITSEPSLGGERLEFTDVALSRFRIRRALGERAELRVATDLLAKQPAYTDEPLWQGASLGSTVGIVGPLGIGASGSLGQLLDGAGPWWSGALAFIYRPKLENEPLHFELSLGDAQTWLDFDELAGPNFWVNEVFARAEVQVGKDKGGVWIGFEYAVPVADRPVPVVDDEDLELAPPVRLDVDLGAVWRLQRVPWDLFVSYAFIDRGELEDIRTTLPILNGGFDQQQIRFGVQFRFEPEKKHLERAR